MEKRLKKLLRTLKNEMAKTSCPVERDYLATLIKAYEEGLKLADAKYGLRLRAKSLR